MGRFKLVFATLAVSLSSSVHAQNTVWKCTGADGRPQYTNIQKDTQGRNCTVVNREVSVVPGQKPAAQPTPGGFPKVDRETQRARDDGRRKILEDELAQEEKLLADA